MIDAEWSLTIGEIVAPFGLAGEVKVRLETDFPDRFSRLKQIFLRDARGNGRLAEVESVRPHKGQILLKIRGIVSIEQAETLRNHRVQIRPQDAVRLPPNEFYIHDLLGCEVVTSKGQVLGPLTDVLRGTANDVYVVGQGKGEILLPVVSDVVQSVDLAARRIVVTPTPGLLPEDDAN
ncbi:MAG TPA: ribosome maturation factor RimM [Chthonomonadaceae bacterium]|nr:ribosome maturation factor RimM [Chthonomonadaceae bacterium]